MKFYNFLGAADHIIGRATSPTITIVCTEGGGNFGFFDDQDIFHLFVDGAIAVDTDGVFIVGYQTNLGFQTTGDATIGVAGRS